MKSWRSRLRFDPIPLLLASGNAALQYFTRGDLLSKDVEPVNLLWQYPEAQEILKQQRPDGSFATPSGKSGPAANYPLIETWKRFRCMVDMFGMTKEYPPAERAAEFLFSCQTKAGDWRGFIASQYATYYTGAILSLLIQAGYAEDARVEKGMRWLLGMRQDDGGWTIPILTHAFNGKEMHRLTSTRMDPVKPDRSKPFSHNWTGMILRAFAAHPRHRKSKAAKAAAGLLAGRFFLPDVYTSYRAADYWIRFQYPFWWNNLVAALDSVTRIGLRADDERIRRALQWLIDHQEKDGLWRETYAKPRAKVKETAKTRETRSWVSLAICRVLKRAYE